MYEPDGWACDACEETWDGGQENFQICPSCESPQIRRTYETEVVVLDPEIPELQLVYTCESRIPRDERGVHLTGDMTTWLRNHGVVDLPEVNFWEDMFHAISMGRETATAKRIEAARRANQPDTED